MRAHQDIPVETVEMSKLLTIFVQVIIEAVNMHAPSKYKL